MNNVKVKLFKLTFQTVNDYFLCEQVDGNGNGYATGNTGHSALTTSTTTSELRCK